MSTSAWTALLVGSYASPDEPGIHVLDASDPAATPRRRATASGIANPSYLAMHPGRDVVHAVSEVADGALVALAIDAGEGSLTELDRVPSHGDGPCHVAVGPDGRHVHAANYDSGSVVTYELAPDGRFGDLVAAHQHTGSGPTDRQQGPHAHCVVPTSGGVVHAVDLGSDLVVRYALRADAGGQHRGLVRVGELALSPGSGPRHVTLHPTWPRAYVVGELDNTVTSLAVDPADGSLRPLATVSCLPEGDTTASTAAAIRVHPDGRHLYVSNRGHDSVAVLAIDEDGGVAPLGHVASGGATPRDLAVHPSGRTLLVANQDSDVVVAFDVDAGSGMLRRRDDVLEVERPVCLVFATLGR